MSDTKKNKKAEAETAEAQAPAVTDAAAEAEKIIADAKAEAPEAKGDPMEELVDYTAPLLPNMKRRDVFVAVNGETLRIQRGVPVKIKRKFYEALQNAAKQEYAAYESRVQIQKQSEKPLAAM